MTRNRARAYDYLLHMREACSKILRYTESKYFTAFRNDSLLQDAVIRNLEVLGEAASQWLQVMPDAQSSFPAVPFRTIISTRNRLIHGYNSSPFGGSSSRTCRIWRKFWTAFRRHGQLSCPRA